MEKIFTETWMEIPEGHEFDRLEIGDKFIKVFWSKDAPKFKIKKIEVLRPH